MNQCKGFNRIKAWENMLSSLLKYPVESLLVYVYQINDKAYLKDFQTVVRHGGKTYGISAITITDFEKNKKVRSGFSSETEVWQLPRERAKDLLNDINDFLK